MWGRGPHIFTEQGPIGFKSGPDNEYYSVIIIKQSERSNEHK